jgi:ribosomal protein L11 methyltransferase
MHWLELRINTHRENAPTQEYMLSKSGALSITLQDNADQPIFEPALGETPLWQNTRVVGLFDAEVDTAEIESKIKLPKDASYTWQIVEDKDWEREWIKHYQPIQCGDNLWICPSWLEPPNPQATNLLLDPGLAFGTGTHPTTFLCLQWLSAQSLNEQYVIDYGCGSGILGIASLLLGATKALGVDIDPQALIATQDNAQRNGLSKNRFPVIFPNKDIKETADVVLANILAGPLVELAPTLNKLLKKGGLICLSGILKSQAETVQKAYSSFIDFDPIKCKDEWVCLTGRKTTESTP